MQKRIITGFTILASLASLSAHADNPIVNLAPDFGQRATTIKKIAIVPIDPCPAALECSAVEQQLFIEFRAAWSLRMVQAWQTRQKMFELGIGSLDAETKARLAEALSVDGFLVPTVPYIGVKQQGAALVLPAGQAPEARVELLFVPVDSDLPLFRGTNQGQGTTMHSAEGLVKRLLKGILQKIFPKRKR